MCVCMYVWMDGCMYGWMDGWMHACMHVGIIQKYDPKKTHPPRHSPHPVHAWAKHSELTFSKGHSAGVSEVMGYTPSYHPKLGYPKTQNYGQNHKFCEFIWMYGDFLPAKIVS